MTPFDTFAMLDWSGGNDTGPRPCRDAIWLGLVREGVEEPPRYLRNRMEAEAALADTIEAERAAGRRLFIGVDFPFGFPSGFAQALTGCDDPFAVWDWLETAIEDGPQGNNRFDVAGEINGRFPGVGPFWFNGLRREIANLPRKDTRAGHGMSDKRAAEAQAPGAFTCWQMGGAGAVGGQMLMGLPVLNRLRRRFYGQVAVWPFEPPETSVALVEIWPGLINSAVKRAEMAGGIRDAHQVRLLARALARVPHERLAAMLAADAPKEGWILGLGYEEELMSACDVPLQPPPLRDDCFALPAGVEWTPVEDALALLRARLRTVVGQGTVPLAEAAGRVLAAPLTARRANPPQANTAVDGYGFAHAALTEGDQVLPLVEGRAAAGVPYPGAVPEGYAVRVLTGAEVPQGVDTVILQEDVTPGEGRIAFRGGLKPGANTRRAGEDVEAGAPVLEAGRVLTPADLALCAAVGLADLPVFERLRVAVISTGDELIEPGETARAGQIHDANRPMLTALVRQMGYDVVDLGRVADDRAALRAALDRGAAEADVILTSGGASSGDEDHVSALLNDAGAMTEWRIAIKPGRPLALGLWQGAPVFGLPGNPVAAMVCALVFARPALGLMAGRGWQDPQGFDLPADFDKVKKPGRREYLRARLRAGRVQVFASEGSGRISGLSWAEGLVDLPEPAAHVRPGDPVRYIPFTNFT